MTLAARLPAEPDPDSLFDAFSAWAGEQGLELYPAQTEALIELVSGSNVVLATPTGSGKSLVATGALFGSARRAASAGSGRHRSRRWCRRSSSRCATPSAPRTSACSPATPRSTRRPRSSPRPPRCSRTSALREGADADLGLVVMDEFHYYADPERGWAWQVPLLELPRAQFLLMSATLGDVSRFRDDLTRRTGRATSVVVDRRATGAAALLLRAVRRCTRRSRSCWRPGRRRSTSCTPPRRRRWSAPRR